jgi:serine protease Do
MRPAWIGARFQQVTPQLGESLGLDHSSAGAIVLHTLPDSPAATAGLQPGDVVLAIDGQPIGDVRALARAIATTPIGHHLSMRIWRDSRQQTLDIVANMDPDNGSVAPDKSVAQPVSAEKPIPLGLQLSDLTGTIRAAHHIASTENGVLIDRVLPLSAAEDAGIQPGDVISRLEDCSKSSAIEITECLQGMSASGRRYVAILLQRDDTFRWVALRLSADGPR